VSFFLSLANKKGASGASAQYTAETAHLVRASFRGNANEYANIQQSGNQTTQSNAPPWICTDANVQQYWAPPNDVKTISDEIEAITDDFDLSGNIVPKVSPRTMSNSALTSFEAKTPNARTRYVYTKVLNGPFPVNNFF
jgi:hypothetical protein